MKRKRTLLTIVIYLLFNYFIVFGYEPKISVAGNGQPTIKMEDRWLVETNGSLAASRTAFYMEREFYVEHGEDRNTDEGPNYVFFDPAILIGGRLPTSSERIAVDVYAKSTLTWDIRDREWNDLHWNNNYVYGGGLRVIFPFKAYDFLGDADIVKHLNLTMFTEYINIEYISKAKDTATHRPSYDFIYGADLFFRIGGNNWGDATSFLERWWTEGGIGYSHNKTNLFVREDTGFNMVRSTITFGLPLIKLDSSSPYSFFDLYYTARLVLDTGTGSSHDTDWNNNIKFGPGLNLFKIEYDPPEKSNIKTKMYRLEVFSEYLNINYFDKVEYIPSYRPGYDFLFGINFRMHFGGRGIR